MMKKILLSALALGMMSSVAMAEPAKMTDAQMDAVTAGLVNNITQVSTQVGVALALGIQVCGVCSGDNGGVGQFQRLGATVDTGGLQLAGIRRNNGS
jgi:hypothetical protein